MEHLLLSSNLEMSLGNIEKYVKNILDQNNANKKQTLWFHLQKLMNMMYLNERNTKRPREVNGFESNSKKPKVDPVLTRFPDELWMKILTYLPTKDMFGSFALVSKHFNNLTKDSFSIKYLHLKNTNFDDSIEVENIKKILTRSTNLTEFKLIHFEQSSNICDLIKHVLKSSPRLKTIKVMTYIEAKACSFSTEVKKFGKKLEIIDFRSFRVDQKTLIELTKIETLKSLAISTKHIRTFSPRFINTLAESKNQLEKFELNLMSGEERDINEIRSNINNLLKTKSKTLKSFELSIKEGVCSDNCVPLTNLRLCQNLELFYGYLHPHDFAYLSEVPNLKTFIFDGICSLLRHQSYEMISLFNQMNMSTLKHLSMEYKTLYLEFFNTLEKVDFTSLENLYFHPNHEYSKNIINQENLRNIVKNAPNLKIIEFGKNSCVSDFTNKYLLKILEERNIFVQFEAPEKQMDFENFLLNHNTAHQKYQEMKLKFFRWSEIQYNDEYF